MMRACARGYTEHSCCACRAQSVTAATQQPCWLSLSGAHEAMLMEDTSRVMDCLSPVPLGRRPGRQGDSGGIACHLTFT